MKVENGCQIFDWSLVQVGKTHLGSLLPGYRFYDGDEWLPEDLREALWTGWALGFKPKWLMEES